MNKLLAVGAGAWRGIVAFLVVKYGVILLGIVILSLIGSSKSGARAFVDLSDILSFVALIYVFAKFYKLEIKKSVMTKNKIKE